jgi:hypothetical protein
LDAVCLLASVLVVGGEAGDLYAPVVLAQDARLELDPRGAPNLLPFFCHLSQKLSVFLMDNFRQ